MKNSIMLLLFVLISFVSGLLGAKAGPDDWYLQLAKPWFNPPGWVFAPVWAILYLLMGISAWLVWRKAGFQVAARALAVFGLQLVFNGAWTWLFFGLHRPGLALADILILWFAVYLTRRFAAWQSRGGTGP